MPPVPPGSAFAEGYNFTKGGQCFFDYSEPYQRAVALIIRSDKSTAYGIDSETYDLKLN